jgi:hypothetical protein
MAGQMKSKVQLVEAHSVIQSVALVGAQSVEAASGPVEDFRSTPVPTPIFTYGGA